MAKFQNSYDVEGEVVFVGQPDPISPTFNVRVIVISVYKGRYEQHIPIQFINKNMHMLDDFKQGNHVIINFQLGGRKHREKPEWYAHLEGRSIQKI